MGKIMINIPLTKYLKEITKEWGETYITKTKGGQVWISDDAPGDISSEDTYYISMFSGKEEYIDKNYIEFNDSGMFMRLPKEISKNIIMEPGTYKKLKDVLKEIKIMEENI
ncbi:hypothetical protein [Clostridium algidicarnis]|uniref:hypothetical protein n=1 Tax=Clostridium algidicarnis TaxID=37659 RepID=UPI001C0E4317|nr:hypothetical protein [Clostridium algidicarnis]MBU3205149.1 hypothetical protein [Clostridium algidicarnis]MBU3213302.1 hypothetical protein [Clostridium algidicarnis]MBU3223803.1 hypothetical protein [Clostridium algidicarnis]